MAPYGRCASTGAKNTSAEDDYPWSVRRGGSTLRRESCSLVSCSRTYKSALTHSRQLQRCPGKKGMRCPVEPQCCPVARLRKQLSINNEELRTPKQMFCLFVRLLPPCQCCCHLRNAPESPGNFSSGSSVLRAGGAVPARPPNALGPAIFLGRVPRLCPGDASRRGPRALRTHGRKKVHKSSLLERVEVRLRKHRHLVAVVVGHVADGRERRRVDREARRQRRRAPF